MVFQIAYQSNGISMPKIMPIIKNTFNAQFFSNFQFTYFYVKKGRFFKKIWWLWAYNCLFDNADYFKVARCLAKVPFLNINKTKMKEEKKNQIAAFYITNFCWSKTSEKVFKIVEYNMRILGTISLQKRQTLLLISSQKLR